METEDKRRQDAGATERVRQDASAPSTMAAFRPKYLSLKIPNPIQHWRSRGFPPHLTVEDGSYFVTFRLGDSLPQVVLKQYQREREALIERLRRQPGGINEHDRRENERLYSDKVEAYLDVGAGSCVLRRPEIAALLAGALQHFEGDRYLLHAWVIMPNHVHVLVTPRKPYPLEGILHSWKSYTADQINRLLNKKGESLWQHEAYDHIHQKQHLQPSPDRQAVAASRQVQAPDGET
jgi:REP element-mobilizing transposase RayT